MRLYETALLIAPNLPEEETDQLIQQMSEVVSKKKGKMVNVDKWGKRRTAYLIQKFDAAVYVFFLYNSGPEVPAELERLSKQNEKILRYLTIRQEEDVKPRKKRIAPARTEPRVERREHRAPRAVAPETATKVDTSEVVAAAAPTEVELPETVTKPKEAIIKPEKADEKKEKVEAEAEAIETKDKTAEKEKEDETEKKEEKVRVVKKAEEKAEEKAEKKTTKKKEDKKEDKVEEKEAVKEDKKAEKEVKPKKAEKKEDSNGGL